MRRRWTDYLRLGRVNYRWTARQMQGLETAELEIERDLNVFYAAAATFISVFMFVQGYWLYVTLRYFYEVLAFMLVFCAWHFWKTRSMISLMNQELLRRKASEQETRSDC